MGRLGGWRKGRGRKGGGQEGWWGASSVVAFRAKRKNCVGREKTYTCECN